MSSHSSKTVITKQTITTQHSSVTSTTSGNVTTSSKKDETISTSNTNAGHNNNVPHITASSQHGSSQSQHGSSQSSQSQSSSQSSSQNVISSQSTISIASTPRKSATDLSYDPDDFYKVLHVQKDAGLEEITRAYRTLAFRNHPLRFKEDPFDNVENGRKTKYFLDISYAFEVLRNTERRAIYDREGKGGLLRTGSKLSQEAADDLFKREFGEDFDVSVAIGHVDSTLKHPTWTKDPQVEIAVPCTLEQIYMGVTKIFEISRNIYHRSGEKIDQELRRFYIEVKPGWKKGTKIIYPCEGDVYYQKIPADQVFVIEEIPHPLYRRDGDDLIHIADIPLRSALLGKDLELILLNGQKKTFQFTGVIHPDTEKNYDGDGMPVYGEPGVYGSLKIKFYIKFPHEMLPKPQINRVFDDNIVEWRNYENK